MPNRKSIAFALASLSVFGAAFIASGPARSAGVVVKEGVVSDSNLCRQTCSNGVGELTYWSHSTASGVRSCETRADVTYSCGAYACVATTCGKSCSSNAGCASGYVCKAGECGPVVPLVKSCSKSDDHTVVGSDGSSYNCGLNKCEINQCRTACATAADCSPPAVCNPSGVCIRP